MIKVNQSKSPFERSMDLSTRLLGNGCCRIARFFGKVSNWQSLQQVTVGNICLCVYYGVIACRCWISKVADYRTTDTPRVTDLSYLGIAAMCMDSSTHCRMLQVRSGSFAAVQIFLFSILQSSQTPLSREHAAYDAPECVLWGPFLS